MPHNVFYRSIKVGKIGKIIESNCQPMLVTACYVSGFVCGFFFLRHSALEVILTALFLVLLCSEMGLLDNGISQKM